MRQTPRILALATALALAGAAEKPVPLKGPQPMNADGTLVSTSLLPLDGEWLLAPDPANAGRAQHWMLTPQAGAKPTKVPWIIQDAFPGYHGVAWYWRTFTPPANPHAQGRALLRFWAVDYKAEVWLNGARLGEHEGGETPFVLDATEAIKPGQPNLLAVRVLNPTHTPIDGIVLKETPHRNKALPYTSGSAWDQGGIIDSVELLLAPPVRVEDLFVRPDWKTGDLRIQLNIRNASPDAAKGHVELAVAPAASGETVAVARIGRELPAGDTLVETTLRVEGRRLWELNDPFLYRVTARVWADGSGSVDEHSVRCGFRDFRFRDGSFRLNGRRLYLRCSHTGNCCPVGLELPVDPDWLRRDLINAKMMRFNAIRFISGIARRYQLDLCDEIGLMVYEEAYASWCLADSPKMAERYDESILGMVRRDRNHPSLVIWGLLNETPDGSVFRHALGLLPALRTLDDSRMVMLNSGRWDRVANVGSLSNPGSPAWEDVLSDQHPYQRVPHTAGVIKTLRTLSGAGQPVFLSEYGIGSAVDLVRVFRHYEQIGKANVEDAQFYRAQRDKFLADWERWRLADTWASPDDYFRQCLAKMAGQRLLGLNAIRSNPNVVGHSLTGTVDQGMTAEGLWTTFRELKPGTADAIFDGFAPLRFCLFVEPVNVYRGTRVRLEAVLANEDALLPGKYPVRLQVVGPDNSRAFERTVTVTIADPKGKPEPPLVLPLLAEDAAIDGPAGKYRFLAAFERGAAAAGQTTEFYVADPADMPPVETEVLLWGEDAGLARWLADHGIRVAQPPPAVAEGVAQPPPAVARREVILATATPPAPGGAQAFRDLAQRIARGSTVIFLCPEVFRKGDQATGWLPLRNKGTLGGISRWLYLTDDWAKTHPIFDGLPAGGLMDYTFYRELIPDQVWSGQDAPAEAVAGGINAAQGYQSGLLVAVHGLGAGRFVLNTLRIRENLGSHPAAERLLRNMLRFAAPLAGERPSDAGKPLAPLPPDFGEQLKAIGYQ